MCKLPRWRSPPPAPRETPGEYATRLALLKAQSLQQRAEQQNAWVIGADTIVVLGDEILGKPTSKEEARDMLSRLSGKQHEVVTGFALLHFKRNLSHLEAIHTKVWFWDLSPQKISDYVDTGEPMDKAGAYGIQGKGAVLVKRIEGCYFNVVGLPLSHVIHALESYSAVSLH